MKNIAKTSIIVLGILIIAFGIAQYLNRGRTVKDSFYTTSSGNLIIGGMASDKNRLESFKKDLEKDDRFNQFWNHLYSANDYEKKGDYINAIIQREKAVEIAQSETERFQVRMGLARLYELNHQYVLALKEYDWLQAYSTRPDVQKELAESRKRVEELKAKAEK